MHNPEIFIVTREPQHNLLGEKASAQIIQVKK